eukprot:tig00000241_g21003.t1
MAGEMSVVSVWPPLLGITGVGDDAARVISSVHGATHDADKDEWRIPLASEFALIKRLRAEGLADGLRPLPAFVRKAVQAAASDPLLPSSSSQKRDADPLEKSRIPQSLRDALKPFQREGVRFGIKKGGRILLADEMGLGKTIQAIAIASQFFDEWPLLIIVPAALRFTWLEAVQQWAPWVSANDVYVSGSVLGHVFLSRARVAIVSYDEATQREEELGACRFKVIIADESHALKNYKTKRTKAILPMLKSARRAILLTGTPALSRPSELFCQLQAVRPDLFHEFQAFADRYCGGSGGGGGFGGGGSFGGGGGRGGFRRGAVATGSTHAEELYLLLTCSVMVRRLKKDVLAELPDKLRQRVIVSADAEAVERMAPALASRPDLFGSRPAPTPSDPDASDDESPGAGVDRVTASPGMVQLYQQSGAAKASAIVGYVATLLEAECKFLLFGHHAVVLDAVEASLRSRGMRRGGEYVRIDGSTPSQARFEAAEHFQASSRCRLAVLSLTAAGFGLTLTAASTVVIAELTWTPGTLLQAEDRVHRIGQSCATHVHYLVAHGTIDDILWPMVCRKLGIVGQTLDGQRHDFFARCAEQDARRRPAPAAEAAAGGDPGGLPAACASAGPSSQRRSSGGGGGGGSRASSSLAARVKALAERVAARRAQERPPAPDPGPSDWREHRVAVADVVGGGGGGGESSPGLWSQYAFARRGREEHPASPGGSLGSPEAPWPARSDETPAPTPGAAYPSASRKRPLSGGRASWGADREACDAEEAGAPLGVAGGEVWRLGHGDLDEYEGGGPLAMGGRWPEEVWAEDVDGREGREEAGPGAHAPWGPWAGAQPEAHAEDRHCWRGEEDAEDGWAPVGAWGAPPPPHPEPPAPFNPFGNPRSDLEQRFWRGRGGPGASPRAAPRRSSSLLPLESELFAAAPPPRPPPAPAFSAPPRRASCPSPDPFRPPHRPELEFAPPPASFFPDRGGGPVASRPPSPPAPHGWPQEHAPLGRGRAGDLQFRADAAAWPPPPPPASRSQSASAPRGQQGWRSLPGCPGPGASERSFDADHDLGDGARSSKQRFNFFETRY